jgi:hypothetical protein
MKLAGKISLALLTLAFIGRAEAATEWVKLYRSDSYVPEWINVITDEAKGQVVGIYDNCFTIDVGIPQGVRIGGLYLVYSERVPHRGKEPVAVLKVVETAGKFSICGMTGYVSGGLVRVGDKVVPVAVSVNQEVIYSDPVVAQQVIHHDVVTEGYISQGGPNDLKPYAVSNVVAAPIQVSAAPQPAVYAAPQPVPQQPVQYNYPPVASPPQPAQYDYPPLAPSPQPAPPQPAYNYPPAPAPAQPPFPGNAAYPPYPNYPYTGQVQLDFDANRIADARLIRTFPLSQPDMNALEIQFRGAWDLYAGQRYYEAFEAFMRQSSFAGNYLSPYWAGMSALKIGDRQAAVSLFNNSLAINPYYEPARSALAAASNPVEPPRPQPAPTRTGRPARRK